MILLKGNIYQRNGNEKIIMCKAECIAKKGTFMSPFFVCWKQTTELPAGRTLYCRGM